MKIPKLTSSLLSMLLLFAAAHAQAQTERPRHTTSLKRNAKQIFIGGGITTPISNAKDSANLNSGLELNLNFYLPLLKKNAFTLGLNAGVDYLASNKSMTPSSPTAYQVIGQTSSTITEKGTGTPKASGFKFSAGPQLNIALGNRLVVSPIFQAGYLKLTQKAFSIDQTTIVGGSTYNYSLLKQPETQTSGLAFIPRFRVQYTLAHWVGLWAEGNYTIGPSIKSSLTTYAPDGAPDQNGMYKESQLIEGKYQTTERRNDYKEWGINGGLVFNVGGGKHKETETTTSHTSAPSPVCNFTIADSSCNGNSPIINITTTWANEIAGYFLNIYVTQAGSPIPATISNNGQVVGISGSRNHQIILNGYNGAGVVITMKICRTIGDANFNCCVFSRDLIVPTCKQCNDCQKTTWANSTNGNQTGSNFTISGTVTSSVPVRKIVAELEAFGCSVISGPPNYTFPNFEFIPNTSILTTAAVSYPFSLTGNRTNMVVASFPPTTGVIPIQLKIDNYTNKRFPVYRVKLIIFKTDGTYCEQYIQNPLQND